MSNTNEHAKNLRRTRADMLGTEDEAHYWECHAAAAYLLKLEADSKGWESDWTKAMHRVEGLQARIDELESVRDAARVFMYQHDNGDDATAELELLDQALANSEAET